MGKSWAYPVEVLEDMDTSDDLNLDVANDDEDVEWERTKEKKRHARKKTINSIKMDEKPPILNLEQSVSREEGVCCSCSKQSLCKTARCECRAANGSCDSSCSCEPTKCSNRTETSNDDLASHGAMLLQTALSDNHSNLNTTAAAAVRRPLSDIGNNQLLSILIMMVNLYLFVLFSLNME